jgi:hypothetical protein
LKNTVVSVISITTAAKFVGEKRSEEDVGDRGGEEHALDIVDAKKTSRKS